MALMFGPASILSFWALHTLAKRQVTIKQGTVAALFGFRHNELDRFHNSVIIAKLDFYVKTKPCVTQGLVSAHQKNYLVLAV